MRIIITLEMLEIASGFILAVLTNLYYKQQYCAKRPHYKPSITYITRISAILALCVPYRVHSSLRASKFACLLSTRLTRNIIPLEVAGQNSIYGYSSVAKNRMISFLPLIFM